jgi:hypothetical protein
VNPKVTDPSVKSRPAECPEFSVGEAVGVTYRVRFRSETGWQPVRSSAPADRRSVAAVRIRKVLISLAGLSTGKG